MEIVITYEDSDGWYDHARSRFRRARLALMARRIGLASVFGLELLFYAVTASGCSA
jgi:hypothetical protein